MRQIGISLLLSIANNLKKKRQQRIFQEKIGFDDPNLSSGKRKIHPKKTFDH